MNDQKIVMQDSDEAAQYRTDIKGWVSRTGLYCGDGDHGELLARYNGCTHRKCEKCDSSVEKNSYCRQCRSDKARADFLAMPYAEWDGVAMLYSNVRDQYYSTPEDAEDALEEGETLLDLELIICKPNYARQIDDDYFCDDLPEDGDLPVEVEAAMKSFNAQVKGVILSWYPGKTRFQLKE